MSAILLLAQAPADPLAFEVASVKLAPERTGDGRLLNMSSNERRIAYTNVNLRLLISLAYRIGDTKILGGEDWMGLATPYDIAATLPPNSTKEQIPAMLQTLLAERFALTLHWATKTVPAYGLTIAAHGSKLKPAAPQSEGGGYVLMGKLAVTKVDMTAIAEMLTRLTGRMVVDRTGLSGVYDVKLEWTPDDVKPDSAEASNGSPSIYTALQEQLGLKLVSQKAPVPFLVIDHANKIPIEN